MTKYATSSDFLEDLYHVLKPFFAGKISGLVYFPDSRPLDSSKEDAVIGFSNGDAEQIQTGDLHVNVFVPDIDNGSGTMVPCTARLQTIAHYGDDMIDNLNATYINNYLFKLRKATDPFAETNMQEHFVAFSIHFQRKTF